MKHHTYLLVLLAIAIIASCKKSSQNPSDRIYGNWSLVNDSTFNTGSGPNGPSTATNYIGKPNDHYDFMKSGMVNIVNKNPSEELVAFIIKTNDTLQIFYPYFTTANSQPIPTSYSYSNLTDHTLTLTLRNLSPTGAFYEYINLKR